jgi:hypothetical protein
MYEDDFEILDKILLKISEDTTDDLEAQNVSSSLEI